MLQERGDTDPRVLGGEHLLEQVLFESESGVERALQPAVDRQLGQALGDHGATGQLGRQHQRPGVQLVGPHHLVDQPDAQRLVGGDLAAREHELLGLGGADEARQSLRAAAAGDDPEQDLRLAQLGSLRGNPQVARQRQLAPTAQGEPGDGRDHAPGDRRHGVERPPEAATHRPGLGRATELGDVGAGGEDAVAPGDDDGSRRVAGQVPGRRLELSQQLTGQRIHLGIVERDKCDAVVATLDVDERGVGGHGP